MVFSLLRDIGKAAGEIVGTVVGVPAAIVAETLSIPKAMVEEAMKAGCKTYKEIKDYCDD